MVLKLFLPYLCIYCVHGWIYSFLEYNLDFWAQDLFYFRAIYGHIARVNQHITGNKCFNLEQMRWTCTLCSAL